MNQVVKIEEANTEVGAFELAQRQAKALSTSGLVPDNFKGNVSNCLIALNMSKRIGADPLQVMQNLYVVHGKPGWSSSFLIACFNQSRRFASLQYEFKGDEGSDAWACRAKAVERETGEMVTGPWVSMAMAKSEGWVGKKGSKWQTMPDLMIRYRAAAFFIRTTAPELTMGLHTHEELQDARQRPEATVSVEAYEELTGEAPEAPNSAEDQDIEDAEVVSEPTEDPEPETSPEDDDTFPGDRP